MLIMYILHLRPLDVMDLDRAVYDSQEFGLLAVMLCVCVELFLQMGKGFECCLVLMYYGWIELIMVRVSCSCSCGCRKGLIRVEDAWWGGCFLEGLI